MVELLAPEDFLRDLACPACGSALSRADGVVTCGGCARSFPCRRGVVDLVLPDALDAAGRREHAANAVELSSEKAVRRRVQKGSGNPFLVAQARRSMRAVGRLVADVDSGRTLVSVGSGAGFELPLLLERRRFQRVLSSDLAWSATALVPEVTRAAPGRLGLFAADFDHMPVRRDPGHIGFVFLALHHAEDPHRTLARLLDRNFDDLVIVEPVTNWLVEILARAGLARRVEYSGARPEWLDLRRVRRIAHERGYAVRVETWWEIPRDRLPRRIRRGQAWRPFYWLVEAASLALRPCRFGSMAAVRLTRS